jgi:hypothetical protein
MKTKLKKRNGQARWSSGRLVRRLWPAAPAIGSNDRIWCGVKGDKHCIVGRDGDPFRRCKIIGYQIEMGEACGVRPRDASTVTLLVRVRMNQRHPLIDREHLSHVDCLESFQLSPNGTDVAR